MPAIIINYLIVLITQLCCGCHVTHLHSKLSTMFTELACITLGLLFCLMWIPVYIIGDYIQFSFDMFYTTYANGCMNLDIQSIDAIVALSAVIIGEMFAAVVVLNIAHYKVRSQVRGQQVLALERRILLIVFLTALIYIIEVGVSFPLCLAEEHISTDWYNSKVFLAIWSPILNECNLWILYIASVRTTNQPLFCNCFHVQRKKAQQAADNTDTQYQTNPSSHPFNQPSHTTYPLVPLMK